MSKVGLIIKREYFTRIKKRSFVLVCLLAPLFLTLSILAPIWINKSNYEETIVMIFDETTIIGDILALKKSGTNLKYISAPENLKLDEAIEKYDNIADTIILRIPDNFIKNTAPLVEVFNKNAPGLYSINKIKSDLYDIRKKLIVYSTIKFDLEQFERRMNSPVGVVFQGQGIHPQLKFYLSLSGAFVLYLLIMIYGVQVLRGISEEKNSRIIEIIISSVHPSTLLKGKIIGIGLVGITQFVIVFSLTIATFSTIYKSLDIQTSDILYNNLLMINEKGEQVIEEQAKINTPIMHQTIQEYLIHLQDYIPEILIITPILFIGGYLLYASFFAAFGSVMDSESDSQSLIFPITLPIVISLFIAYNVINNPNSALSFWASIFPLSSPVVMTARLPFLELQTDWWQIVLSISLLALSTWASIKFAARIYRTGILIYGQKPSLKTICKWYKQSK